MAMFENLPTTKIITSWVTPDTDLSILSQTRRPSGRLMPTPDIPYTGPWIDPVDPFSYSGDLGSLSAQPPLQYTITSTILDKIIPMCYGPNRMVGQIGAWDYNSDTDTLILGVIFCFGEQDSVTELKINGEDVATLAWVNSYATNPGDGGTTAISSLLTGIETDEGTWSSADTAVWEQYAHAVVSIDTASASAPGSFKIEATCGGRKIAPVGGGAKTLSTNPVRVAYDIETDSAWKGLSSTKIHSESWTPVRDWCGEIMDDGNTRYEFSGVLLERNPDIAREMVLKHCLAYTFIDVDGKRRMWCEMLPGAISGGWTAGGDPIPSEDDFESYSTGALPADWVADAAGSGPIAWTIADVSGNKTLLGTVPSNSHGNCKWDAVGEITEVELTCRVKLDASLENFSKAGIFARGSSFSSGQPATAVVLYIYKLGTDSYRLYCYKYTSVASYTLIGSALTMTGVTDDDWVYLSLYLNGNVIKYAWDAAGAPSEWDYVGSQDTVTAEGYVGTYIYNNGAATVYFDDFECGLDGATATTTSDYLTALDGDGAATTELSVGQTIIYNGVTTSVLAITDDDNIQIADEVSGNQTFIRTVDYKNLGINDWVKKPSCSELNALTVPDVIRASYTDGTNFGAQSVEEQYAESSDRILEMSLPGCSKPETAGRVAKTSLLVQHLQIYTWHGTVKPEIGATLEPGDVITFDTDILTEQKARVLPPVEANKDGTYNIQLRNFDPLAYSDAPSGGGTTHGSDDGWDGDPGSTTYAERSGNIILKNTFALQGRDSAETVQNLAGVTASDEAEIGDVDLDLQLKGSETRPDYNGNPLALLSDTGGSGSAVLADGTVPLTADWDAGGYEIRARTLESDVATGTAPLTVASTTAVTNLNADLLDGNHAAAFAAASHSHVEDDITDLDHTDDDAIHDNVAGEIAALTSVHPAQTDSILLEDASDSNNKKRSTYENLLKLDTFGKSIFIEVSNDSGGNMSKGDLCYISGDSSGVPQVTLADADAASSCTKMLVVLSENINTGSDGTAIAFGVCNGFSGLTAGAVQYVHTTAGDFTETAPSGTGDIVRVAGYAISSSEIFLNPGHTWVEIV